MNKEEYNPEFPKQNAHPLGDTIDIQMDICNKDKVIRIGKCLDDEEQEDHATLLHDFSELFAWTYLDIPGIDPKIVTKNIVLAENAKLIRQKIQKTKP